MIACMRWVELALSLAFSGPASFAQDAATTSEALVLRFHADAVDGVDELVVKARESSIVHREWDPIVGARVEVLAAPEEQVQRDFVVRARTGRPSVSILQRPSARNDGTLRVLIDDGPHSGASPLSFEIWAVPANHAPRPFDVVIVTIDSLRPDHLGSYGYGRPTSPNLDTFAGQSARYTNAFSTSSFTPPSHASLLTSRYVGDHGLHTWEQLAESELTLAEILSAHGYRTGASVNLSLLSSNGLGQGVEWRREGGRDARTIVSEALDFVRERDARPFFLWLHLYDVHRPYGRVGSWSRRFSEPTRPGLGDGEDDYNLKPAHVRERKLTDADLAHVVDRYDAGIAYVDAELAPLLAELSLPSHKSRTLFVITADHGENLLEHGERLFSHDPFLFATVGRIPMLIRSPDGLGTGKVHADPVSLIDVAPTVLATLGIAPPPSFAGRSLLDLDRGASWPQRELFQECWGWERLAAVRTTSAFVLRDVKHKTTRAFALADDPGERHPLDPTARGEFAALVTQLDAFVARVPVENARAAIDPELQRRLRGLGYTDDGDEDH